MARVGDPSPPPGPASEGARDRAVRGGRGQRKGKGETGSVLRELPVLIVVALGLALLIKTFLVQAFFIPSDSMQNTLQVGDRVLVNKLTARFGEVKRGEVVVFRDPGGWLPEALPPEPSNPVLGALKNALVFVGLLPSDSEKDLIKRVIGAPGDHVVCCDKQGRIMINDVPLDEPYIYPGNPPSDRRFDVRVPEGRLWVMGDHRALSADSRVHLGAPGGGTIPEKNVIGRAIVVVWPFERWRTIPVPAVFDEGAFSRTLGAAPTVVGSAAGVPIVLWRRRLSEGRVAGRSVAGRRVSARRVSARRVSARCVSARRGGQ